MALSCVLLLGCAAPPFQTCIAAPPASSSSGSTSGEFRAVENFAALKRGGWVAKGGLGNLQLQRPLENGIRRLQMREFSSQRLSLGQKLTPGFVKECALGRDSVCVDNSVSAQLKIWSWGTSKIPVKRLGVSTCASSATAVEEAVESTKGTVEEELTSEPAKEEPKLAGGEGGDGRDGGDRGGGGGGGGDGAGSDGKDPTRKLSPSQILTFIYAALVGGGGVMGFVKSGSTKSLFSGGGAALVLLLVFSQLPVRPTTASIIGLGLSAVLLGVMYPRFKSSGKFMPAGLVALVSLIMTGGYLHGILRTTH